VRQQEGSKASKMTTNRVHILPYRKLLQSHLMPPKDMGLEYDPSSMMSGLLSPQKTSLAGQLFLCGIEIVIRTADRWRARRGDSRRERWRAEGEKLFVLLLLLISNFFAGRPEIALVQQSSHITWNHRSAPATSPFSSFLIRHQLHSSTLLLQSL
jgi:hypothetical protein